MDASALLLMTAFWLSTLQYDNPAMPIQLTQEQLPGEVLQAELHLIDGSHLRGALLLQSVPLQTKYARITLELRFVSKLLFKPNGEAAVTMTNGDRLQGTIQVESLTVEALMGKITVPLKVVEALYILSPDATPAKGLVAYYPLNDGAEDLSGQNNTGDVHGAVPAPDRFGRKAGALRFDGINSCIIIPSDPSLDLDTSSFTINLWFKTAGQPAAVLLRRGLAPDPGYMISMGGGRVIGMIGSREDRSWPDTLISVRSDGTYNDNRWHRVTFIRDRSFHKLVLYVDDALAAQPVDDVFTTPLNNARPLTIGRWEDNAYPNFFLGSVDDVRIARGVHH